MDRPFPFDLDAVLGPGRRAGPDRRGLPEAQAMRLREVLDLYTAPNPYRRGDLVQPRRGLTTLGPGPYLVIEILPEATTPSFGAGACCSDERFDMRVAVVTPKGDVALIWASSFRFEPWATPADPAPEDGAA